MSKYEWPYNKEYAAKYNSIWREGQNFFAGETSHNLNTTKSLMTPGGTWLDAGCGTGYFLSLFPGVKRAGFDLTPVMLEVARKANPDALFFKQQNLLEDNKEWHDSWDLVTCSGMPWCYLSSMDEIEIATRNLASYVSPSGSMMIEPLDISDFVPGNFPHYYTENDFPPHVPVITGFIWSIKESGVYHHNMIFPSIDHWVRWLSEFFLTIEILPCQVVSPPASMPRRLIVCRDKRPAGDTKKTHVINKDFVVENWQVKFVTPEERAAIETKRNTPPRIIDLPLSYLLNKIRPWRKKFWQTLYIVAKEKIKS